MIRNNLGKWFAVQSLQNFAWTVNNLFLSIFIWQKAQGTDFLYIFYISLFIFLPLFGLMGAFIAEYFGQRLIFTLSFLINILLMYFVSLDTGFFLKYPMLFGVVNAAAIGFYAVPRNAVLQIFSRNDLSDINAKLTSASSFNSLVVPLVGSLWVYVTGGYSGIFILAAFFLILAAILVLKVNFPKGNGRWDSDRFLLFFKDRDIKKLTLLWFLNGLRGGLEWSIFGVIIFKLVGEKITGWGLISFLSAALGIATGILYSKFISGKKDAFTLLTSSLLYTCLGILLIAKFDIASFVLFVLGTSVVTTFMGPAVSKFLGDTFKNAGGDSDLAEEFYSFLEFPLALGRVIPLAILFYTNSQLNGNVTLLGILLFASTIPLISTFVLQKMLSFETEADY